MSNRLSRPISWSSVKTVRFRRSFLVELEVGEIADLLEVVLLLA